MAQEHEDLCSPDVFIAVIYSSVNTEERMKRDGRAPECLR